MNRTLKVILFFLAGTMLLATQVKVVRTCGYATCQAYITWKYIE